MIFGVLKIESILQENDKTRLDGVMTYRTPDEAEITKVEIEPFNGAGFIEVAKDEDNVFSIDHAFLDYQYDTAGDKIVTLRVTTDGAAVDFTKTITVITALEDKLFSGDNDLLAIEPEINQFLPLGRSSFLNVHRKSQQRILEHLDERRYFINNKKPTKEQIFDRDEVRKWSTYLTLQMIFEGIQSEKGDYYDNKSFKYTERAEGAANRAHVSFDSNADGDLDDAEDFKADLKSGRLIRR